jgi:hypothetical protein
MPVHFAIVNETLGRPLDDTVMLDAQPYRVVGIVKDFQFRSALEGALPMAFIPYWQNDTHPQVDSRMCIRVAGDVHPRGVRP